MDPISQPPPPGTPASEIEVDAALARRLVAAQHPDLAHLPVTPEAFGWDNCIFRLGDDLALRLPRRSIGGILLSNEQRWLPLLQDRLPLKIPAPVRVGAPQEGYPWPWSITPWLAGETADLAPPDADQGEVLAGFFAALHHPAPADAPRHLHRGVPLSTRADGFETRLARLAGHLDERGVRAVWADALAAPDDAAPTWIQGDPHPRNVLVEGGRITAMIDWGDMGQGDRASDLAAVWMVLPGLEARRRAVAALPAVTLATWRRARGWAAMMGLLLLEAGLVDDPRMAAIAERTFARLFEGP